MTKQEDGVVNIRKSKGEAGDVIKAGRLWVEMVKELMPEAMPNIDWWRKMAAVRLMHDKGYVMFVAEEGQRMVGFLTLDIVVEPATSKIHAIGQHEYVEPEHRNGTVGGRLYEAAVEEARLRGAEVYELSCDEARVELWAKRGYLIRACVMRKEL